MLKHREPIKVGDTFRRWIVLGYVGVASKDHQWLCRCDCGTVKAVSSGNLRRRSSSCGCYRREVSRAQTGTSLRHGESGKARTPEYAAWVAMMQRCYCQGAGNYRNYGAVGIKVHERWHVYENFLADLGRKPSSKHSLDRYPNSEGNYEPDNVRWATASQQSRNTKSNRMVTVNGESHCIAEWSERTGISPQKLYRSAKPEITLKDFLLTKAMPTTTGA